MDCVAQCGREAQLLFQLLHYAPVVAIGFYVVQRDVNRLATYVVMSLPSFVVTLVL